RGNDGRSRRSYCFALMLRTVHCHALKKFYRSRDRRRYNAVPASYNPPAGGQWRYKYSVDTQQMHPDNRSNNIDNSIHSTHFMEMDPVRYCAVYLGFCSSKPVENSNAFPPDIGRQPALFDQGHNITQVSVMDTFVGITMKVFMRPMISAVVI